MCIRDSADLVRRSEAIFYRSQNPETVALIPFEIQYRIDNVFQQARSGDGTFLRDMPDDEHRHVAAPVSYTHLRAHETVLDLVCRLLLETKNNI